MDNERSRYNSPKSNLRSQTSVSRPMGVTLLAFGVLIITGINCIRLWQAIHQWQFIGELIPALPYYQALSGLFWSLAGFPLTWGLWRGSPWAAGWVRWAALAYTVYIWLDRLILRKGLELTNLPFALAVNILILIFMIWILSRTKVHTFFQQQ